MRSLCRLAISTALLPLSMLAQQPQQLSPQAAYDDAAKPLESVRRAVENWSDIELTALAVSMKKAGAACDTRTTTDYSGDDLIALARLCSFGQRWDETHAAAARYIDAVDPAKPQLSLAYAMRLSATLHATAQSQSAKVALALRETKAMLAAVPYDTNVDAGCAEAISYLQLLYTREALQLQAVRQPLLLAALALETPPMPRRALYAAALAQAELLQYSNRPAEASASRAALDLALGDESKLAADDALPIADARRQYDVLGNPLPAFTLTLSLQNPSEAPSLDVKRDAATAFLLFPDWCAQCLRLGHRFWKSEQIGPVTARLYGLLAMPAPDEQRLVAAYAAAVDLLPHAGPARAPKASAPLPPGTPEKPKSPAEMLLMTHTYVVPPETTALFAASGFPYLIVVDHEGIVRFAADASEASLEPGGYVDQVVEHVAETWPPPAAQSH